MSATIKVLLLLLLITGAESSELIEIGTVKKSYNALGALCYTPDINRTLTPEAVLHSDALHTLPFAHLGSVQGPFWTRLKIKNGTSHVIKLVLFNPLAGINGIEVYVYDKNNQPVFNERLGDMNELSQREVRSRFSLFSLTLLPSQEFTVVAAIENFGIYNLGWKIEEMSYFMEQESAYFLFFGVLGGFMLFYLLYTFSQYRIYKQKGYLILSLNALVSVIYQYSFNGFSYWLDIGVSLEVITALTWNFSVLSTMLLLLFARYFFNMKAEFPKLSYGVNVMVGALAVLISLTLYAQFFDPSLFQYNYVIQWAIYLTISFFIVISLLMLHKKRVGSFYYFLGQGSVFAVVFINTLGLYNVIFYHSFFKLLIPAGLIADSLFLLAAQYLQTSRQQTELLRKKELMMENARFFSIGQAIGNITHQWRKPLTKLGSTLTMLETTFHHNPSALTSSFQKSLPKLKFSMEHMKKTMNDFSYYYSTRMEKTLFSPKEVLQKGVIELLESKLILKKVKIIFHIGENLTLYCHEHVFTNIMMILMDNALDAFEENENNTITITIMQENGQNTLLFDDNAGGIQITPSQKIFDPFISSKPESAGHGIGLALCKMLVEERLNGTIKVENIEKGARFSITFK